MRRYGGVAVFVSLFMAVGCSDGRGSDPVLMEGDFPVPGSAVSLGSNVAAVNEMMGQETPHVIGNQYYDTKLGRKRAFQLYQTWLPEGEDYRNWQWCEERTSDREPYQSRSIEYLDRAANQAVTINISWDRESRIANPPDTTVTITLFDLDRASAEFRASRLACGG